MVNGPLKIRRFVKIPTKTNLEPSKLLSQKETRLQRFNREKFLLFTAPDRLSLTQNGRGRRNGR